MDNLKTILVTGGTGNQGGAVARSLNKLGSWKVKVLSRTPESLKGRRLINEGIEVVKGDLNFPNSYKGHLDNVHGIFSMQTFADGIDKEIGQGKYLADLGREKGVQHFVYSSVSGADLKSGIPHFESKNVIEEHIKKNGIPYSIVRPTSFYENLLNPEVRKRIIKGKLVMPLKKGVVQEFTSVEDIGTVVGQLFNNPSKYIGKTITIASDKMSMDSLAKMLSEVTGREIKYQKLPGLITRLVMGKKLHKMFGWVNRNEPKFIDDMTAMREEFPGLTNMRSWLEKEFKEEL